MSLSAWAQFTLAAYIGAMASPESGGHITCPLQELAGYFGGVAADLDSTGGAGGAAPAAAETPRPGGPGAASSPDAAAQQAAAVNQVWWGIGM